VFVLAAVAAAPLITVAPTHAMTPTTAQARSTPPGRRVRRLELSRAPVLMKLNAGSLLPDLADIYSRTTSRGGYASRRAADLETRAQKRDQPAAHYHGPVSGQRVPGGVVHKLPADLRKALIANTTALGAWKDITPLARNEFICWVEDARQDTTRERRIRRTQEELEEGQRRPCCWPGCEHRGRIGR
jgi:hypothetical protein